jgi:DNA repair protein RadC
MVRTSDKNHGCELVINKDNKIKGGCIKMQQSIVEEKVQQKMKRIKVVSLQMIKEKTFPYATNKITDPMSAVNLLREFIQKQDREVFVLICLDSKNKVNAINVVSIGNLNSAIIHPREIFKTAILANSASIIVGHNHPSGCPIASKEDISVTERIKKASEILGIQLLDHVIIGDEGKYYSFKEKGHI